MEHWRFFVAILILLILMRPVHEYFTEGDANRMDAEIASLKSQVSSLNSIFQPGLLLDISNALLGKGETTTVVSLYMGHGDTGSTPVAGKRNAAKPNDNDGFLDTSPFPINQMLNGDWRDNIPGTGRYTQGIVGWSNEYTRFILPIGTYLCIGSAVYFPYGNRVDENNVTSSSPTQYYGIAIIEDVNKYKNSSEFWNMVGLGTMSVHVEDTGHWRKYITEKIIKSDGKTTSSFNILWGSGKWFNIMVTATKLA